VRDAAQYLLITKLFRNCKENNFFDIIIVIVVEPITHQSDRKEDDRIEQREKYKFFTTSSSIISTERFLLSRLLFPRYLLIDSCRDREERAALPNFAINN
jgi:hypothetical protein